MSPIEIVYKAMFNYLLNRDGYSTCSYIIADETILIDYEKTNIEFDNVPK